MRPKTFATGISMITDTFGEAPIKGPRLGRIKDICEGKIDDDGFIEICGIICDNFRQYPLPSDFTKAVNDWRRNYHSSNGRSYSEYTYDSESTVIEAEIRCEKCNDIGYVRIRHRTQDSFDSLMLCGCIDGPVGTAIPEWDAQLVGVYNKTPVPNEWFKPSVSEDSSDIDIKDQIWSKVDGWRKWKLKAEKHWRQLRDLDIEKRKAR